MKIIDRKAFLALPAGVLYSKFNPYIFESFAIKGVSWEDCNDFLSLEIASAISVSSSEDYYEVLDDILEDGKSVPVDLESFGRDGLFDDDQLFAVWEAGDLESLRNLLTKAVPA